MRLLGHAAAGDRLNLHEGHPPPDSDQATPAQSEPTPEAAPRPPGGRDDAPFWCLTLATQLERLATDGEGLSDEEAAQRLERIGANEPAAGSRLATIRSALPWVLNPLNIILLCASGISIALGQVVDAAVITLMVVLSVGIDALQARRSRLAAERLRRRVEVRASVRRAGVWQDLSLRLLVPGDRIRVSAGDIVPADARLLASTSLYLDEAAFTGESLPVSKRQSDDVLDRSPDGATNAIFMGTVVTGGSGEAVVARTGAETTYASIAARLQSAVPPTAFDRGLRDFSTLIARTIACLVVFVIAVNLISGRDPFESLLFAVALAVGLTPEFLPMILTVTQAEGAMRMARAKVIVRQLSAIQNFGSIDVLCSDKTGTLTEGSMRVDRALDTGGAPSESVRLFAYLNAATQTGLRSPFDEALIAAAPAQTALPGYRKLGEIPFDFDRRRLSVVLDLGGRPTLVAKGAPESILGVCRWVAAAGIEAPLQDGWLERIDALVQALGDGGFRLLAVATRTLPVGHEPAPADEHELTFQGLIAFSDPLKPEVAAVVEALRRDGIRLKIISGDAEAVTRHVCAGIGFPNPEVATGEQLERFTDAELERLAEDVDIFARIAPEQKLRLIQSLQRRGHVVGYLGDGINDAPSLRAADVGISVAGAVDVARDAARVVLLEKSLAVLHDGVIEGRKSFGNVMKYIMMGTSSNFGNMLSMAGAVLFLPFLPLLPPQVLLNNWLYDLSQMALPADRVDANLVQKPRHWDVRFIRDFMLIFGPISSLYDFLTFFALRHFFHAGPELFHTGWFVESLATQVLVVFVIRTAGSPLRSRASPVLVAMALAVVGVAFALPFSPLSEPLGFVAPPLHFMLFVVAVVVAYLTLVEVVKRIFYRYHPLAPPAAAAS
jgi:Mg2+-importing ATPase